MKTRNYLIAVAAAGLTALNSELNAADLSSAQYSSKPWLSRTVEGRAGESRVVLTVPEVNSQQRASKAWLVSPPSPLSEIRSSQIAEISPSYVTSKPWLNPSQQVLHFEIAPLK